LFLFCFACVSPEDEIDKTTKKSRRKSQKRKARNQKKPSKTLPVYSFARRSDAYGGENPVSLAPSNAR
jgi:hypothetical protein